MKRKEYPLLISDCLIIEKEMYFFAKNYNALFVLNLVSGKKSFLGRLPDEHLFGSNLVQSIQIWGEQLIFVPKAMKADKIWMYDLKRQLWNSIEVTFDGVKYPYEKIAYSFIYNEFLVLIGCYYNGIVRINLNNKSMEYYLNIFDKEEKIHSLFCCELDGENLIIPSPNKNQVYIINLNSLKIRTYKVGNDECIYSGICKCGDYYWLSPRCTCPYVVRWDGERETRIYALPEEIKTNGAYIFSGINHIGDDIYMIGGEGKKSLVFSGYNYSEKKIMPESHSFHKCGRDNEYIVQDYDGKLSILWDGIKYEYDFLLDMDDEFFVDSARRLDADSIVESKGIDLNLFVNMLN